MQTNLIGNLEPMEIEMDSTRLTIRGVRPKAEPKNHQLTEQAERNVNDPSTT
jgi:hypothetical protein